MLFYFHKMEQAYKTGFEQGFKQGIAQALSEVIRYERAQGRVEVYQEWHADWEKRRQEAIAKGLPFDEPPPPNPDRSVGKSS